MNKRKLYAFSKKYLNPKTIQPIVLLIVLAFLILHKHNNNMLDFHNLIDFTVFGAIVLVLICTAIANLLSKVIMKFCEDSAKLHTNYDQLMARYPLPSSKFFKFDSPAVPLENNIINDSIKHTVTFPVIPLWLKQYGDNKYVIAIEDDKYKNYKLPTQVAEHSTDLMSAHIFSDTYNNVVIRLDDIQSNQYKSIKLVTSRTNYFDSLITNRAMDYSFKVGKTIRDIYEPGPYLNELSRSKLSNHLGFNGFVEFSDGMIVFARRAGNVSIGKNMLSVSVEAALKAKYALNSDLEFTAGGLSHAICKTIKDELNISMGEKSDFCNHIIAFYRDVVEGGKPQFLFYVKNNDMTSDEMKEHFNSRNKLNKKNTDRAGNALHFLSRSELARCALSANKLILPSDVAQREGRKEFTMMPSSSASIAMMLKYFAGEANVEGH